MWLGTGNQASSRSAEAWGISTTTLAKKGFEPRTSASGYIFSLYIGQHNRIWTYLVPFGLRIPLKYLSHHMYLMCSTL